MPADDLDCEAIETARSEVASFANSVHEKYFAARPRSEITRDAMLLRIKLAGSRDALDKVLRSFTDSIPSEASW